MAPTTSNCRTRSLPARLAARVQGLIASFTGDGAYDQDRVTASAAERCPVTAIIVPPRANAIPSDTAETAPTQRDRHLQQVAWLCYRTSGSPALPVLSFRDWMGT